MSQQDLFDYVMNTPHNTNPAILKQKIEEISGASSWNDLKDKPFSSEVIEDEILHEYQSVFNGQFFPIEYCDVVIGEKYLVKLNGVEYLANVFDGAPLGRPCLVLINEGTDISTGEGVVFQIIFADGIGYVMFLTDETELTISITRRTEIIKTLDEKYLPDSVATKEYVDQMLGVIENGTY